MERAAATLTDLGRTGGLIFGIDWRARERIEHDLAITLARPVADAAYTAIEAVDQLAPLLVAEQLAEELEAAWMLVDDLEGQLDMSVDATTRLG